MLNSPIVSYRIINMALVSLETDITTVKTSLTNSQRYKIISFMWSISTTILQLYLQSHTNIDTHWNYPNLCVVLLSLLALISILSLISTADVLSVYVLTGREVTSYSAISLAFRNSFYVTGTSWLIDNTLTVMKMCSLHSCRLYTWSPLIRLINVFVPTGRYVLKVICKGATTQACCVICLPTMTVFIGSDFDVVKWWYNKLTIIVELLTGTPLRPGSPDSPRNPPWLSTASPGSP